jgi:hypothetical protein
MMAPNKIVVVELPDGTITKVGFPGHWTDQQIKERLQASRARLAPKPIEDPDMIEEPPEATHFFRGKLSKARARAGLDPVPAPRVVRSRKEAARAREPRWGDLNDGSRNED